jgi:hypothetical protein
MAQDTDYESDIEIDEASLDLEWLDQPKRMMRYCRLSAEANREADLAKERLDVVKARLVLAVRSNPEKFGLAKATNEAVESAVLATEEYEEASQAFVQARYEASVALGAVRSFDHRKTALENLVRLHAAQYFAGPSVPRDITGERQRKYDNTSSNRKVVIKRNR